MLSVSMCLGVNVALQGYSVGSPIKFVSEVSVYST
jgi:hypothetical protein